MTKSQDVVAMCVLSGVQAGPGPAGYPGEWGAKLEAPGVGCHTLFQFWPSVSGRWSITPRSGRIALSQMIRVVSSGHAREDHRPFSPPLLKPLKR
jgi:hypothetical protein